MAKLTKLPTEKKKKSTNTGIPVHGVYGLAFLFVVASIGYMAYRVIFGSDMLFDKIATVPALVFAVCFLVYKSFK